ncbi:MAG: site-2 protease family protein, partial [Clostridia bacterium]|nr:site-2 protease family protein [Clostridia bacterium]
MNLGTIVIALFIFGFLIFIHELGHYLTARAFGVSIREFAIGMGPKLFSHCSQKTGIRYSLRVLPIGGFVSMFGEDEESEDENAFHRKPVWQRIIVTAAGAFMNLAVGVIVMSLLVMTQDILPSTEIGAFVQHEDGTPNYTQAAGFQVGDKIVEIEGTRVRIANELVYEVMRRGIEPLDVTVLRNGER